MNPQSDALDPTSSAYVDKIDHSRYGRSNRSRRRTAKIVALAISLAISLLILGVVSIYSNARISGLEDSNNQLQRALEGSKTEVAELKPKLATIESELQLLVANRFPDLEPVANNKVLNVKAGSIKNIVFTEVNRDKKKRFEYRLVVENDSVDKLKPAFKVLVFNEFGVNIGTDEQITTQVLGPGESDSYSGNIEFFFPSKAVHFHIEDLSAQAH